MIDQPGRGMSYLLKPNHTFTESWPSDPHSYFRNAQNEIRYRVNNSGFRGPDFVREDRGLIRIAILGDSLAWGNGVRHEDRFSTILEDKLRNSHLLDGRFEVLNFGLGAYSTVNEVALFEHTVLDYEPDICVIWFYLNDIGYKGFYYKNGNDSLRYLRRHSVVFDLILGPVDFYLCRRRLGAAYEILYSAESPQFKRMQSSLRRFAELCRRNEILPVLAVHPELVKLDESYPFAELHTQIVEMARTCGIHAVDLLPYFEGHDARNLWVHEVDRHPNHLAHSLSADGFFQEISSIIREDESRLRDKLSNSGR